MLPFQKASHRSDRGRYSLLSSWGHFYSYCACQRGHCLSLFGHDIVLEDCDELTSSAHSGRYGDTAPNTLLW